MSANAATSLLAQMLTGISYRRVLIPDADDAPDFSLDHIVASGDHAVETVVQVAAGDRYRVTVEWLSEESP